MRRCLVMCYSYLQSILCKTIGMMENLMSAHGSLGGSDDGSGSGIQERKGGEGGNFQLPTTNCKNHVDYFTVCP